MIKEINCSSVSEFLDYLLPWKSEDFSRGSIFRGHANANYELVPTALREANARKLELMCVASLTVNGASERTDFAQAFFEYGPIRDFYQLADTRGLKVPVSDFIRKHIYKKVDVSSLIEWVDGESWLPNELLETAALAQHYGVPTRLLDWTYDPFVAAFFASREPAIGAEKLCIWSFNIGDNMISHALSYLKSRLNIVHPPYAGNPNLAAQRGVFTHVSTPLRNLNSLTKSVAGGIDVSVNRTPLDKYLEEVLIGVVNGRLEIFKKLTLPVSMREELYGSLRKFGYGPARIYAGYDGVAKEIIERESLARKSAE